jgi:hypothetical protein
MSDTEALTERFAVVNVGGVVIGVEAARIREIRAAGAEFDLDLAELLGLAGRPGAEGKLVRLCHGDREVILAVAGTFVVGRRLRGICHKPGLIAAALERACLRGVVRDGDQLIYLLDVGRIAARLDEPRKDGGSTCE